MAYTSIGKRKFGVYILLILLDIAAVALAARVNIFQEFYFMADLFPLGLSIATLAILVTMLLLDLCYSNAITAKPPVEIGIFIVLSIFWLAFNAFSTSRWRFIPLNCSSIPEEFADERVWCRDVQGLKSVIWLLFIALLFTGCFVLRYCVKQHKHGNRHVWNTSLSRYNPRAVSEFISDDFNFRWSAPTEIQGGPSPFEKM
ncbi:hypothetical protein K474DRAFT_1661994 [Panus rudis PR-1116 ss-1]|nr:hypothetical protein K474DRAFT_1661994 [Panus rudis PR-1116 ss-1]